MSEETKTRKFNVLQIVPSLDCGGVERGTIDIAKALCEAGNGAFIITKGGSLCSSLGDLPCKLIKHNVSSKNPITIYRNIAFIENFIKENKIDIVHARSRAPAWSAYFACKRAGVRFVTTFHGVYGLKSWFKRLYNSVMVRGERVIAVSNFVKEHIKENYECDLSKVSVIYRGVDLEAFNPDNIDNANIKKLEEKYNISKSAPIILMPSRMTSWKGQNILIEALAKLKTENFFCILVGDLSKHPDYVDRLKDLIVKNKLQSKVQIYGPEKNLTDLYNLSSIVISASIEPEAFGRTVVEAQAMKKIVIATNIGGAAETVEDKKTGFHVIPSNPDDLAEKIKYALGILGTDEEKLITKSARESVSQNFSLKKMQEDTLDVYKSLI